MATGAQEEIHPRFWFVPQRLRPAVRRWGHTALSPVGSIAGVRTSEPVLAITFDDGPSRDETPAILDVLARHGARATFFQLAARAVADPALTRRIVGEGHEVALHGVDHVRVTRRRYREVARWLAGGKAQLEELAGRPVRWFRPPNGSQGARSYLAARRSGLQVVVWTAVAEDWLDLAPDDVAARALAGAGPGGILLLHDAHEPDAENPAPAPRHDRAAALELILAGLADRGYRLVTVSELVAGRRLDKRAWFKH